DDALAGRKAIHLGQDLVEGLFALVVAATEPRAADATDGIDLIDEEDARAVLLGRLEHIADAAGPNANEHLDEFRARDGEERHAGLAGDGAGQQGLARAGWADQEHALGDPTPQPLKLLRVLEELDDLLELRLGVLQPGH